jgi:hypothetical protein
MDISPDHKALILLTTTESKKKRLVEESEQIAARLLERLASPNKSATVMSSLDIDPFRSAAKIRGYEVTIELRANAEPASFAVALEGFADDLCASAHIDLLASAVLVGRDYVFRPSAPQPVRFQYLMRRRADYTHEAYAKRYAEVHSDFGIRISLGDPAQRNTRSYERRRTLRRSHQLDHVRLKGRRSNLALTAAAGPIGCSCKRLHIAVRVL